MRQALLVEPAFFYFCTGVLGLVVGSFLNVVIVRLPRMLEANWQASAKHILGLAQDTQRPVYNLAQPRSACPNCQAPIHAWQNIPVISFLLLRGRCAGCGCRISWQYPLVEILSAVTSLIVAWQFGPTLACALALILTWSLLALTVIDWHTQLLPDSMTLPLLWLGLLAAAAHIRIDPISAIIGATAGYLALWLIFHAFRLLTGKEGMGYGDFKLLAALGAWLGWQQLPLVLLLASVTGAVSGILLLASGRLQRDHAMPFGPFLAAAGWLTLVAGDTMLQTYFSLVGPI